MPNCMKTYCTQIVGKCEHNTETSGWQKKALHQVLWNWFISLVKYLVFGNIWVLLLCLKSFLWWKDILCYIGMNWDCLNLGSVFRDADISINKTDHVEKKLEETGFLNALWSLEMHWQKAWWIASFSWNQPIYLLALISTQHITCTFIVLGSVF